MGGYIHKKKQFSGGTIEYTRNILGVNFCKFVHVWWTIQNNTYDPST
jgi:hypothetical protein